MLSDKLKGAALSSSSSSPMMILEFDTSKGTAGTTIGINLGGTVNVTVDWGDGMVETFTTTGYKTHTYAVGGIYTVEISGALTQFGGTTTTYNDKLTKCLSFGDGMGLTSLANAFGLCTNLIQVPTSVPSSVTDMSYMFYAATAFNQPIDTWDTSAVTAMSNMFAFTAFNQPIDTWDTSAVTTMSNMFQGATAFNQPIDTWDTSAVTSMADMFRDATAFNKPIDTWDTSAVTSMAYMFQGATAFNQPIGTWDTSAVTSMADMFRDATAFDQDLSAWCVGNILTLPLNFDTGATSYVLSRPGWGTCPNRTIASPITRVGTATGTTTATLPAHVAGDIILCFAFNDASTTTPTLPTGWTSMGTQVGTTCAARVSYIVATSGATAAGTWTNATTVIFAVYRGVSVNNLIGIDVYQAGTAASVTYPANVYWPNLSRVVAFAGHKSINTTLGNAPTGLSMIVNPVDAVDEAAMFDSVAAATASSTPYASWPSTSVAVGGTAAGWITCVLRLPFQLN